MRPWGYFLTLVEAENYKMKKIVVNPGQKLSLQLHNYRAEHWIGHKGIATVQIGEDIFSLKKDEYCFIPKKTKHRLSNDQREPIEILEIQRGDKLTEEDIIRLEDIYCRS